MRCIGVHVAGPAAVGAVAERAARATATAAAAASVVASSAAFAGLPNKWNLVLRCIAELGSLPPTPPRLKTCPYHDTRARTSYDVMSHLADWHWHTRAPRTTCVLGGYTAASCESRRSSATRTYTLATALTPLPRRRNLSQESPPRCLRVYVYVRTYTGTYVRTIMFKNDLNTSTHHGCTMCEQQCHQPLAKKEYRKFT